MVYGRMGRRLWAAAMLLTATPIMCADHDHRHVVVGGRSGSTEPVDMKHVIDESRSASLSRRSDSLSFLVTAPSVEKGQMVASALKESKERVISTFAHDGLVVESRTFANVGVTRVEIKGHSPHSASFAEAFISDFYQSGVESTIESDVVISLNDSPSLPRPPFSSLGDSVLKPPTDRRDRVQQDGRLVPNDSLWDLLWGMKNSAFPEAWSMVYDHPNPPYDPEANVKVIVIDSGVERNHPDLSSNMWVNEAELNGADGVDDDGNGYIDDIYGWDAVSKSGDPMDDNGHGSHVAGTIGAVTDNGLGVSGANWKPAIVACRFIGSNGMGSTADAIDCINYSLAVGAKVSNNSWGSGFYSAALKAAVDAAEAAGQVFVSSAGNSGQDVDASPSYPGAFINDNIINVAATNEAGGLPSWSNYGATTVDIAAPGEQIASTYYLNGNYVYYSGTSMASPHVSGMVALMLVVKPDMTFGEVKAALADSVDPPQVANSVAWGVMNAQSTIQTIFDSYLSSSSTTTAAPVGPPKIVAFPAGANCRTQCELIRMQCDETNQLMLDTDLDYCRTELRSTFPVFFGPAFQQSRWNAPTGCFFDPPSGFNIVLNTNDFGSGVVGCDAVAGTPSSFQKVCSCVG